jgi:hypothetical protein
MSWTKLVVHLEVEPRLIACSGGKAIATVSVLGETNGDDEENSFEAFLKEDHILPDKIWKSGKVSAAPNSKFEKGYSIELWCNKHCKVVGPHGSTHEAHSDVYAYVLSDNLEWKSDEIAVKCIKEG